MTKMNIPFFDYPALFKKDRESYLKIFEDVGSRGAYILQKDLREFEANLAQFLKVKYAFGVANGTDALVIALKAAGIQAGDEVILPSHTYVATAASVHFTGGVPILVECGDDHMVSAKAMREAITQKTRFLMPVQLNGRTCDMDEIQKVAKDHNLMIVEDAAQGLGSKFKDRCAGTFGAAGTFSFYPAKVLGCFGDGGAIVTNDDQIAESVALLRDHGRNDDGEMVTWGLNSRLDNLQAAILNFKLKKYPEDIKRRRTMAQIYHEELNKLATVKLPPPPSQGDHFDVYQNYEIEADRRDQLRSFLSDRGVGTIIQWGGKAVHQFKGLGFDQHLPVTEAMTSRFVMLPMHVALTDDQIKYICDGIKAFYKA